MNKSEKSRRKLPIVIMDDDIFKGSLTTQKILTMTGQSDLMEVEDVVMKVDTRVEIGIANIGISCDIILGKWLPRLKHLKLNNSFIPSIR
jgi:hypothetical protein